MTKNREQKLFRKNIFLATFCFLGALAISTSIIFTLKSCSTPINKGIAIKSTNSSIVYEGYGEEPDHQRSSLISLDAEGAALSDVTFTYSYNTLIDVPILPDDLAWESGAKPTFLDPSTIEFVQNPSQDYSLTITAHCDDKTDSTTIDIKKRSYTLTQNTESIYKNGNQEGLATSAALTVTDNSGNPIPSGYWQFSNDDSTWKKNLNQINGGNFLSISAGDTRTLSFSNAPAVDKDYKVYFRIYNETEDIPLSSSSIYVDVHKEGIVITSTSSTASLTRPASGSMPTAKFSFTGTGFDTTGNIRWEYSEDNSNWVLGTALSTIGGGQIKLSGGNTDPMSRVLTYDDTIETFRKQFDLYVRVTVNTNFTYSGNQGQIYTWSPMHVTPLIISFQTLSDHSDIYYNGSLETNTYSTEANLHYVIGGFPKGNEVQEISFNNGTNYNPVSTSIPWSENLLTPTYKDNTGNTVLTKLTITGGGLSAPKKVMLRWHFQDSSMNNDALNKYSAGISLNLHPDPVSFNMVTPVDQADDKLQYWNVNAQDVTREVASTGIYIPTGSHWEFSKDLSVSTPVWTDDLSSLSFGTNTTPTKLAFSDDSTDYIKTIIFSSDSGAYKGTDENLYVRFVASSKTGANADPSHVYQWTNPITICATIANTTLSSSSTALKDVNGSRTSYFTANATGVSTDDITWQATLTPSDNDSWKNVNDDFSGITGDAGWYSTNLSWASGGTTTAKTLQLNAAGASLGYFAPKTISFRSFVINPINNNEVRSTVIDVTLSPVDPVFSVAFDSLSIIALNTPTTSLLTPTIANCPASPNYTYEFKNGNIDSDDTWHSNIKDVPGTGATPGAGNGELSFTSGSVSFTNAANYGGQSITLLVQATATFTSTSPTLYLYAYTSLGINKAPSLRTVVSYKDYTGISTFAGIPSDNTIKSFVYNSDSVLHDAFTNALSNFSNLDVVEITDLEDGTFTAKLKDNRAGGYDNETDGGVIIAFSYNATVTLASQFTASFITYWNNSSPWSHSAGVPTFEMVRNAYFIWSPTNYLLVSWNDIKITTTQSGLDGTITVSYNTGSLIYSGSDVTGMEYHLMP